MSSDGPDGTDQQFERFEQKADELTDGLLTAYAAGYAQAVEDQSVHGYDLPEALGDKDVRDLKHIGHIQESHYYFWEGRTLPLGFWIPRQFDLDNEEVLL